MSVISSNVPEVPSHVNTKENNNLHINSGSVSSITNGAESDSFTNSSQSAIMPLKEPVPYKSRCLSKMNITPQNLQGATVEDTVTDNGKLSQYGILCMEASLRGDKFALYLSKALNVEETPI